MKNLSNSLEEVSKNKTNITQCLAEEVSANFMEMSEQEQYALTVWTQRLDDVLKEGIVHCELNSLIELQVSLFNLKTEMLLIWQPELVDQVETATVEDAQKQVKLAQNQHNKKVSENEAREALREMSEMEQPLDVDKKLDSLLGGRLGEI